MECSQWEVILDRQDANRAILIVLADLVEKYPDMRFSQILVNYDFVEQQDVQTAGYPKMRWRDEFYLESDKLLERILEAYNK